MKTSNKKIKKLFPTLSINKNVVYLDNAATTLRLESVISSINLSEKKIPLNPHSFSENEFHIQIANEIKGSRKAIANWINAEEEEISFIPSASYGLNILALSFAKLIKSEHFILSSKLEHSSNIYPWIEISNKIGSKLIYLPLNDDFTIDKKKVSEIINKDCFLVAISHVYNSIGAKNDIKELVQIIKKKNPNCFVIIDACQSISCHQINVKELQIDALVFSAHKIYGPSGIGVLWARKEFANNIPHLLWGGGKNSSPLDVETKSSPSFERFEIGTLPTSQIIAFKEVFLLFEKLNWEEIFSNYQKLYNYAIKNLSKIDKIIIYNNESLWSNIITFNIIGFHAHDVASYLAQNYIFVRGGSFCVPFFEEIFKTSAALRISFAIYNTKEDIDKLVYYLKKISLENLIF